MSRPDHHHTTDGQSTDDRNADDRPGGEEPRTVPVSRYRRLHLARIARLGFWPDCRHRYVDGTDHCTVCDDIADYLATRGR